MTTYIPLYKENSVESVPGGEVSVVLGEIKQYDNCKKINTTWSDSSKIDLKLSPASTRFGASQYNGSPYYTISITLDPNDPKSVNSKNFLKKLDNSIKNNLKKIPAASLGLKKKLTDDQLETGYSSILKEKEPYDPTITIKIRIDDETGSPQVHWFKHNETTGKLDRLPNVEKMSNDIVPANTILNAAFRLTGITVVGNNYYPQLIATQIGIIDIPEGTGSDTKCHIDMDNWESIYNELVSRNKKPESSVDNNDSD